MSSIYKTAQELNGIISNFMPKLLMTIYIFNEFLAIIKTVSPEGIMVSLGGQLVFTNILLKKQFSIFWITLTIIKEIICNKNKKWKLLDCVKYFI